MNQYLVNGQLNNESIVVSHSLGAHFIPKYLSEKEIEIKCYISCAGFLNKTHTENDFDEVMKDFIPTNDDIEKDILLMKNRYAIYSDNDPISSLKELEHYANMFKAKKIFVPNIGHMGPKSRVKELPEAIEIIKKNI